MADSELSHVALLAFPFGTHAPPLFSVGVAIAAAAPHAYVSFLATKQCCAALARPSELPDNMKMVYINDGVPEGYAFVGTPQEHPRLFMDAAPASFRLGLEAAAAALRRRVSCLILDSFLWFGEEIAEEAKVPWISFWTSGIHALSCILHSSSIVHRFGIADGEEVKEESLDFIPGMWCAKVKDMPEGIVFGNREMPFSKIFQKMGSTFSNADAVCINSFEEMDPTITADMKSKMKTFLSIGPLHPSSSTTNNNQSDHCISWLNEQKSKSVAYVSFGTVAALPKDEIQALAEALEESRVPFLWSLKEEVKQQLPQSFIEKTKERGLVVGWAPQREVLCHGSVGVFVTHCGWNSVLESTTGGVPMICRPFFGDQRLNMCMVEHVVGAAVGITRGVITKNDMVNKLVMILGTEKGEQMRCRMISMKVKASMAVQPKGSSSLNFQTLLTITTTTTTTTTTI